MPNMKDLIEQHDFYHLFQPIHDLRANCTIGYEALIRSKSNFQLDQLFDQAEKQNMLFELDLHSIALSIKTFFSFEHNQNCDLLIFVNVFPSTMVAPFFENRINQLLEQYGAYTNRIVLEINESIEQSEIWRSKSFLSTIQYLRAQGFSVALDDVGEGTITFKNIIDIAPDIIKLDRFFAKDLCNNKQKQKAIKLFVEYCRGEVQLILEGIEQFEDLSNAISLGIIIGQGYWIGVPVLIPDTSVTTNTNIL